MLLEVIEGLNVIEYGVWDFCWIYCFVQCLKLGYVKKGIIEQFCDGFGGNVRVFVCEYGML